MASPPASRPPSRGAERALVRLARRGHRARQRDPDAFADLARRAEMDARQLRLLADAWRAGGAEGVAVLGPAPPADRVDVEAMRLADGALEAWRHRHFPLEILRWDTWRNRVTVWHLVAGLDRLGLPQRRPLLQLRLGPSGRWHLYAKAAQGEWWPVPVEARRGGPTVHECLEVVRVDGARRFWSGR